MIRQIDERRLEVYRIHLNNFNSNACQSITNNGIHIRDHRSRDNHAAGEPSSKTIIDKCCGNIESLKDFWISALYTIGIIVEYTKSVNRNVVRCTASSRHISISTTRFFIPSTSLEQILNMMRPDSDTSDTIRGAGKLAAYKVDMISIPRLQPHVLSIEQQLPPFLITSSPPPSYPSTTQEYYPLRALDYPSPQADLCPA